MSAPVQQDIEDEEEVPEKSPDEIMREQEAKMLAKYGGMKPGKKKGNMLMAKEQKFFDSADWALNKEAASKTHPGQPGPAAPRPPEEKLLPKLEPTVPLPRRVSHLEPDLLSKIT